MWDYEHTHDNTVRYTLGRIDRGVPLIAFGVNPSTATPEALDPTLKSVERIACRHGYESFMMLNVYPLRSTDPAGMPKVGDVSHTASNLMHIERIFAKYQGGTVLAAWGTIIEMRPYLPEIVSHIATLGEKYNMKFVSVGKRSKKGHPHHPLYLSNSAMCEPFDIREYVVGMLNTKGKNA